MVSNVHFFLLFFLMIIHLTISMADDDPLFRGGNYFIAGGEVRGKQIIGEYPDILSEDGPLIFEPGIVIPTKPWDAPWNGIAQWFGITSAEVSSKIV